MAYSVIIPSNSIFRLRKCIGSIFTHHKIDPKKIIVIDDSNSIASYWTPARDVQPITIIPGVSPFIYARNVNIGINAADRDDIVLVGDDVLVKSPGAFDLMAETACTRMNAAVVSAGIVGLVSNPHQKSFAHIIRETPNALAFVCVYLPREWIDRAGLLDERFDGYGWEDTDWCQRAHNAGGRMLVDGRVIVLHNDAGTTSAYRSRPDIAEKAARARKLFMDKWGVKGA